MSKSNYHFFLASFLMVVSLPTQAWVAAGPRGVAAGGAGYGWARGAGGGAAAWNHGVGVARGPYGGTAAWAHGGYYRPPVAVVRPPMYGGYYGGYSGGQVAGAAVAGLAVGAMAGAAMASSHPPPAQQTVIVEQKAPVYVSQMPIGTQVTVLPGNCTSATHRGAEYYICGSNWFKPYFGNASVYYQVVSAPY